MARTIKLAQNTWTIISRMRSAFTERTGSAGGRMTREVASSHLRQGDGPTSRRRKRSSKCAAAIASLHAEATSAMHRSIERFERIAPVTASAATM